MNRAIDLLMLHVPKFVAYYRPFGEYMSINLLPMGTLGLADLAVRKGYKAQVLHLGIEWIERGASSPLEFLKERRVRVIGIPLHWHQQSHDVTRIAEEIKKEHPGIFLVLGGFTASFFHREILEHCPWVDAVIRGDAEKPLLTLLESLGRNKKLDEVPNLTWRSKEGVKENPVTYVAEESDLEELSYANLNLMKEYRTYVTYLGMPFVWAKGLSKDENRRHFHLGYNFFPLNVGRGCRGNCTWCGGGHNAQRLIGGRRNNVIRSPEKVAETVGEAGALGYEMIHIAFDAGAHSDEYYRDLFRQIRKRDIRLRCYFECFSLPSDAFLKAFASTFVKQGSVIAFSPESGDERVRRGNKSFAFTNDELMKTLSMTSMLQLKADIFFAMGIPGEKYHNLFTTRSLIKDIKRYFYKIGRIWVSPIAIEPGAPWHLEPEEFGIIHMRQSFEDFRRASAPGSRGQGYYIPDYNGNKGLRPEGFEALLQKAKCRHFCTLHPDPARASNPIMGRLYCRYLSMRQRRKAC